MGIVEVPVLSQNATRGVVVACTTAGVVALHAGAAVFFASHDPYNTTVFPPCPVLALTGWQCPGCGGTRAAYSLFHGDVAMAMRMNPLVVAGYAIGALLVGTVGSDWLGRPRLSAAFSRVAIALVAVAGVYVTIIRNLLPH
jgi:hypothetical protein